MLKEILVLGGGLIVAGGITPIGWSIHTFNYLNSGKINVETQWSNVKTEYQRRYDLLPNIAEAVKSFKNHEAQTYVGVADARSKVNLIWSDGGFV